MTGRLGYWEWDRRRGLSDLERRVEKDALLAGEWRGSRCTAWDVWDMIGDVFFTVAGNVG